MVPGEPGPDENELAVENVSGEGFCDDPPAKRVHLEATPESRQSSSVEGFVNEPPVVARSERTAILKLFKKERRLARRIFRNGVQVSWDKDVAEYIEQKENRFAQDFYPSVEEVEAEAFENYMFDKMCDFDQEYAEKLNDFRGSLRVAPNSLSLVLEDPRLVRERTNALWEGLRRVYFGELEDDVPGGRRLSSGEIVPDRSTIENLRREIDELEARARRRRVAADDDEHPSLDVGEGDSDSDDDFPSAPRGEGGPTNRATSSSSREPAQIRTPDRANNNGSGEQISSGRPRRQAKINAHQVGQDKRRPVKDRWYYEPVQGFETPMLACLPPSTNREIVKKGWIQSPSSGRVGAKEFPRGVSISEPEDGMKNFWGKTIKQAALHQNPGSNFSSQENQSSDVVGNLVYDALLEEPDHGVLAISDRFVPVDLPRQGFSSDWGASTGPDYFVPAGVSREGFADDKAASDLFLSDPGVIVGSQFFDSELGWCEVTGWGVYTGPPPGRYPSYFYVPEVTTGREQIEQFSSEQEVLSWIRSAPDRAPDGGESSQGSVIVRRCTIEGSPSSISVAPVSGNGRFGNFFRDAAVLGIRRSQRIREKVPAVKSSMSFLSQRVIRRILAAKESLFKFGTFVPANDREADSSPESHRWQAGRALECMRSSRIMAKRILDFYSMCTISNSPGSIVYVWSSTDLVKVRRPSKRPTHLMCGQSRSDFFTLCAFKRDITLGNTTYPRLFLKRISIMISLFILRKGRANTLGKS